MILYSFFAVLVCPNVEATSLPINQGLLHIGLYGRCCSCLCCRPDLLPPQGALLGALQRRLRWGLWLRVRLQAVDNDAEALFAACAYRSRPARPACVPPFALGPHNRRAGGPRGSGGASGSSRARVSCAPSKRRLSWNALSTSRPGHARVEPKGPRLQSN